MLDNTTINYIISLIEDYFHQGKSFTSLDIANQTKAAGYFVRNRWISEWLRSNVSRLAYERGALFNSSLITVDSKADNITLAYLYHHFQTDPDSYLDRDQNPISPPVQDNVTADISDPNTRTRNAFKQLFNKTSSVNVKIPSGDDVDVEPAPSSTVIKQHAAAVSGKTSSQGSAVKRDIYGRFTRNPAAPTSKPTHFLKQKRDEHGRFIKG